MLSSICFMPASLTPQSLPPGSPTMFRYVVGQHRRDVHARRVVPDEERLLGLLGIVAVEEVDDLGRKFPRRSSWSAPASAAPRPCRFGWPAVPSADVQASIGRGGVRQVVVLGSTAAGYLRQAGDRRVHARWRDPLLGRALVDVGEAHALHGVEVIEVAPEFLEPVCGRQGFGGISEMVLAELACRVAEIIQEPGEVRRAGPQIGRASGNFRQDHADAHRLHAGDERSAASRAALLGIVRHEFRTFVADAIDVRRFADHQALVVDARLHPADVVAHDEQDVGLLRFLGLCRRMRAAKGPSRRQVCRCRI